MSTDVLPETEAWWWSVLLLLWAAVPAQRVVDVLKAIPASADGGADAAEEVDSGGRPGEPLDQAAQRRLLGLMQRDPLLVATGGMRRAQRSRLLKRLVAGVEAARQVAADELVEALTEDMVAAVAPEAGLEGGSSPEADWLYKTFAYGPMPPPSHAPGVTEDGSGSELPPLPLPLPTPLPAAVVQRHARGVAAALGRRHEVEGAQGQHGGCAGVSGDAAEGSSNDDAATCGLISLRVSGNMLAGSTGCHEWEASFALAQLVLRRPELFRGQRVLELGAGAGLVGVALARAGAQLVAATDGSAEAVSNCAANMRLNLHLSEHPVVECGQPCELAALEQGVAVCRLAWEEPLPSGGLHCDSVVASDVLYDPDVVPVLVSLLVRLLQPMEPPDASGAAGGARMAYIATLRRNPATLQLFLDTVAEAGLHAAVVDGWGDPGVSSAGGRPQSAVRFHGSVLDDVSVADRIVIHRITHCAICCY